MQYLLTYVCWWHSRLYVCITKEIKASMCQNFLPILNNNTKMKFEVSAVIFVNESCHSDSCPIILSFISCLYGLIHLCCNPLMSFQPCHYTPEHHPVLPASASVHIEISYQSLYTGSSMFPSFFSACTKVFCLIHYYNKVNINQSQPITNTTI